MKNILALFLFVVILLITPIRTFAQYGQYGQAGPSQTISINKFVGIPDSSTTDPTNANYVHNLTPVDPRFKSGQNVYFKIVIKNTSSIQIDNIILRDFVPWYINPLVGPGVFDINTRTIEYNAGNFAPGEEKVFYFTMQVFSQDKLPSDKGLFCLINKAEAHTDQTSANDTSQLCIEKQVTPGNQVPKAGTEYGLFLASVEILALGAGLTIKRLIK